MKKLILISLSLLSLNVLAQDYIYNGIKNVDATVGLNSQSEPTEEKISENCYTATVGTRGSWQGCDGLLIVDNNSLRQMVLNDENYSDTNIFTGQVTDLTGMFNGITVNFSIKKWDVSNVTDFRTVFYNSRNFNQNLNSWDVSNATIMFKMFYFATSFNQPLDTWNVSNVTNMNQMFNGATNFNQPLNNWNTSNVVWMDSMFQNADSFNQPLNNWNVNNVFYMRNMFRNAISFNQKITDWCVNKISIKPRGFDTDSGFENQTSLQPKWGTCPQ